MAVTLTGGDRQVSSGTFQSVQALLQSTATTLQTIFPDVSVTTIAGGTATSFNVNRFLLPGGTSTATDGRRAIEGMEKWIFHLGTGEAKIILQDVLAGRWPAINLNPTATTMDAAWVSGTGNVQFTATSHFLRLMFVDNRWWPMQGAGSIATVS